MKKELEREEEGRKIGRKGKETDEYEPIGCLVIKSHYNVY